MAEALWFSGSRHILWRHCVPTKYGRGLQGSSPRPIQKLGVVPRPCRRRGLGPTRILLFRSPFGSPLPHDSLFPNLFRRVFPPPRAGPASPVPSASWAKAIGPVGAMPWEDFGACAFQPKLLAALRGLGFVKLSGKKHDHLPQVFVSPIFIFLFCFILCFHFCCSVGFYSFSSFRVTTLCLSLFSSGKVNYTFYPGSKKEMPREFELCRSRALPIFRFCAVASRQSQETNGCASPSMASRCLRPGAQRPRLFCGGTRKILASA